MKFSNFFLFTIISFTIGSCLVLPKTENGSNEKCKLVTKSWTLEVHELGKQNNCDAKCVDFVKGSLGIDMSKDVDNTNRMMGILLGECLTGNSI